MNTADVPTALRILSPSVVVYCNPDNLISSLVDNPCVPSVVIVTTPVELL